ncbi:hypothetical protein RS86_03276 [Microbacterium azadirachtae]|uniref:Uncharacterized protein n=2 Tax=Microbacterium azadirachtae TaxID=582680 RepID=A0A0F0LFV3_9MICO|nr:hypothetical protein RS86_03276 [Microbacterium azadirachtae]
MLGKSFIAPENSGNAATDRAGIKRRTVIKGAAWSVPVIAAAFAAPMAAASGCTSQQLPNKSSAFVRGVPSPNTGTNGYHGLGNVPGLWWEWPDGTYSSTIQDVPANYVTYTRTWPVTVTPGSPVNISGTVQANFGSNSMPASRPAGLLVQTSLDGLTWTSYSTASFVTRSGMGAVGTTALPINNGSGNSTTCVPAGPTPITWGHSAWNSWSQASVTAGTFDGWPEFQNLHTGVQTGPAVQGINFSDQMTYVLTVVPPTSTIYVRYVNFIAPLTGGTRSVTVNGQTIQRTSDDIGITDPFISCAAAGTLPSVGQTC